LVSSCHHAILTEPPLTSPAPFTLEDPAIGLGLVPTLESPPPGYAWEGGWQERAVSFPSALSGATLRGEVFAPYPPVEGALPGVVIVPGSGPGIQSFYQWSARDLAGHGYLALTVDPQGVGESETFGRPPCTGKDPPPGQSTPCTGVPFQQAANYVDAAESGLDYLVSQSDPYRGLLNTDELGLAGHSLGARAVSYVQSIDPRVKAIVAWDNLASNLNGDAGSPSGGPPQGNLIGGELPGDSIPIQPKVPAFGEASDAAGLGVGSRNPEVKKTAYDLWVHAGVPSMEVDFAGSNHLDWAQTENNAYSDEVMLYRFEYYTRAWFDLFLRHDASAISRLTSQKVGATPCSSVFASDFTSALFLPIEHIDDPNLRANLCD
jgi:dienelactone hydrolase